MSDQSSKRNDLEESYLLQIKKLERELRLTKSAYNKLTTQFRAKEALEEAMFSQNLKQQHYMDMLLENTPCLIILLDKNGCFKLCTKSFLNIVGVPNFDYIDGLNCYDVLKKNIPETDLEDLRDVFRKVADNLNHYKFNKYIKFNTVGEQKYYTIQCHRLENISGGDSVFLAIFVDNTELEEQKIQAEKANRSKSDFIATMSHEIRTPMNAVIGLNDILSRTVLDKKQKKYLTDMRTSAHTLLGIINDILDFSKVESGKMDIVNAPYNVQKLFDKLHSMFIMIFNEKNLTFRINFSIDFPEWVIGDELRVQQAVTNVISNAAKYTETGGAELNAYLDKETNELVFEVKDTGIGIEEDNLPNIFMPFERFDITKTRTIQGTGLGMPISYRYCELMGGSLTAQSTYGIGSVFTIRLPYVPCVSPLNNIEQTSEILNFPNLKILVVDDIEINLLIVSTMLENMGIKADIAQSAKEAFEKTSEKEYDIIFMDHMMPEINGIDATKIMRKNDNWLSTVPIIALTANVVNGAEQNFLKNGFSGFLPKPLEFDALKACIKKICSQMNKK
ncbi:MAG: response regulator [Oscillospiraceae bacterium]|jgi:signal transduction histidine kinase/ActR/RegA family two-component response regulator|nr:response regulator [Oscillospiraceae bacterium]